MAWIKRNLFFVVGGAVALVLLGGGGFYAYQAWSKNSESTQTLTEIYGTLQNILRQVPSPGNDKINNTALALSQNQKVQGWITGADKYFEPVKPVIPAGVISSESFASALRRTIDLLQREADTSGVTLPPKYDFSFSAERPLVKFAPAGLRPLAVQLGEVKAISEILFSARLNALDSIQRIRVSDDDLNAAQQGDYIDLQPVTNNIASITPYVVTFRCFTPELAGVICAFANSPNAFFIKAINVQPAGAGAGVGAPQGEAGRMGFPQPGVVAAQPPGDRGGLPTVLKEQLLRVTIEVDIVKPLPRTRN